MALRSETYISRFEYEAAKELLDILKAQSSLYEFGKQAWHLLEGPNVPFKDSWHFGALCEHLEACKTREIRNLLINMPPRTGKSSFISVFLSAWWWLTEPSTQFFYASFDMRLSRRDSLRTRRLIESEWYQRRFGHLFSLMGDQNTIEKFENNMLGSRACTSTRSSSVGHGGDIKIIDDPNVISIKPNQVETDANREAVIEWYSGMWVTRFKDPKTEVNILSQQRSHQRDLSGYVLALEDKTQRDWVHLMLPMEYESSRRCKTIILPSSKGKAWEDPREKEGEYLWPSFMAKAELDKLKRQLASSYRVAGQLQQRPAPSEGGLILKKWFPWWKKPKPPKMYAIVQSWDTALTDKKSSSYSACTTWGLFLDDKKMKNLILLGRWRQKVAYPDLRVHARKLYEDYRGGDIKPDGEHIPDLVLVESKATGSPLIADLRRAGIPAHGFDPTRFGDKISRVQLISHYIQDGRVWLPAMPPDFSFLRPASQDLLDMCALFPNAEANDLVDTMSQALIHLIYRSASLEHSKDEKDLDEPIGMNKNPYHPDEIDKLT